MFGYLKIVLKKKSKFFLNNFQYFVPIVELSPNVFLSNSQNFSFFSNAHSKKVLNHGKISSNRLQRSFCEYTEKNNKFLEKNTKKFNRNDDSEEDIKSEKREESEEKILERYALSIQRNFLNSDNYQFLLMILPYISTILGIFYHYFYRETADSNFDFKENSISSNKELKLIERMFEKVQTVVIVGMQGIGKSSIARNYALEHKYDYSIIWKINAENSMTIKNDLKGLKIFQELQEDQESPNTYNLHNDINLIDKPILLIFDKATSFKDIQPYIPSNQNIKLLITSRQNTWPFEKIQVTAFPKDLSTKFLCEKLKNEDPNSAEIKQLVKMLEGWPLALNQCREYIFENKITVKEFLNDLKMKETLTATGQVKSTLDSIFQSFDAKIKEVLGVLGFCASAKIPEAMLKKLIKSENFDEIKEALTNYSFIRNVDEYWKVNRVIFQVLSKEVNLNAEYKLKDYYLSNFYFDKNLIYGSSRNQKTIKVLIPHVNTFVHLIKFHEFQDFLILNNLIKTTFFIENDFKQAEKLLDLLMTKINKVSNNKVLEKKIKIIYQDIGDFFYLLGNYEKALEIYLLFKDLIENEPVESKMNLASLYYKLGCCYEKVLEPSKGLNYFRKCENFLAEILPHDNDLRYLLGKLPNITQENSKNKNFADFFTVSDLDSIAFQPSLLQHITLLANTYMKQGFFTKALPLYEQLLQISHEFFPIHHLHKSVLYKNIGKCYNGFENSKNPLEFYLQSKSSLEMILSENHPEFFSIDKKIGKILYNSKNYKDSLEILEKSKNFMEQILPITHKKLGEIYNLIGLNYYKLGKFDEALESFKKSKRIRKKKLKENDKKIFEIFYNLGRISDEIGDYQKALKYFLVCEKMLKIDNYEKAFIWNCIGNCYLSVGKSKIGLNYYNKAKNLIEYKIGTDNYAYETVFTNFDYCAKTGKLTNNN